MLKNKVIVVNVYNAHQIRLTDYAPAENVYIMDEVDFIRCERETAWIMFGKACFLPLALMKGKP